MVHLRESNEANQASLPGSHGIPVNDRLDSSRILYVIKQTYRKMLRREAHTKPIQPVYARSFVELAQQWPSDVTLMIDPIHFKAQYDGESAQKERLQLSGGTKDGLNSKLHAYAGHGPTILLLLLTEDRDATSDTPF